MSDHDATSGRCSPPLFDISEDSSTDADIDESNDSTIIDSIYFPENDNSAESSSSHSTYPSEFSVTNSSTYSNFIIGDENGTPSEESVSNLSEQEQETSEEFNNDTSESLYSSSQVRINESHQSQSGARKRAGDSSLQTTARKVSRVAGDDQIPSTSRAALCQDSNIPIVKSVDSEEEGEETINCSICMEPYTNSGPHRICCLKCGHIFGHSCIQRWLAGQKSCPLCNSKALMGDIRLLFTKNLIALDSAELQRTKNELEIVKVSKEKLNYELNRVKLSLELKEKELQALKSKQCLLDDPNFEAKNEGTWDGECNINTKCVANVGYEKNAGFRVGAYCSESGALVVSQAIGNPLYPSGAFGIRTIKMYDTKFSFTKSVLHQRQIRDLCFAKYTDNTVLTCGIDRKAVLSNIEQKVVIHTFNVQEALWSCAWDSVNPNIFYVGTGNGRILSYDVRSPKEVHNLLHSPLDTSPVARMVFTDKEANYTNNGKKINGLLIQHLNSVWYCQVDNNSCEQYQRLPLEGAFTNMDYDSKTQLLLLTTRASSATKEIVNLQNVYQLSRCSKSGDSDSLVTLESIRTAELPRKNQVFMTRSKIWNPYDDKVPAAVATDWSEKEEALWFPTTNKMSLHGKYSGDIVVDFVPISRGDKEFVVSATSDRIRLIALERVKSK